VHDVAAAGFADPADYEAARPSYPDVAVDWIAQATGIAPERSVVDLAAGTGKFTRLLERFHADLLAVEPVAGMRAALRSAAGRVPIVAGTAEAIPLRGASVDVVTIAQAWHWFDHERASAELARVVRPGGAVAFVWNARDRSSAWVDAIWGIMDRVEKRAPWRDHENWRDSATPMRGFEPYETAQFRHEQPLAPDAVVRRVASVSHVAVLPEAERQTVLDEVREVLATHPDVRGLDVVRLPYRVDCFACRRTAEAVRSRPAPPASTR